MVGAGLKGVALLAEHEFELRHPMLERLLRRGNISRDYLFFGTASEPNLIQQLVSKHIKVIVPLGERALQQTLGESGIERWRGRIAPHQHLPGVWVMPAFAPSRLMSLKGGDVVLEGAMRHPPRFHGVWMRDLQKALAVAQSGFTRSPVAYLEDPPAERFAQFADEYFAALALDSEVMLSTDIETPYQVKESNEEELEEKENILDGIILRVSFCFRPGYAVSVPWSPTYLPTIVRLLKSRGIVCVWNGSNFDVPIIRGAGFEVLGQVFDFMDAYHLLESDLPKGLEWVSSEATDLLPWKHLASVRPAYYSAIDADAALQNALYIKAKLIERGQWNLFINHVVRLMPLLAAAGGRGNKMDLVKREEIRAELTAMKQTLIIEAQAYVPKQLHPRTLFKTQPDGVVGDYPRSFEPRELLAVAGWDIAYEPSPEKVCSVCGQFASNKTEHYKGSVGPVHPKTGKPTRLKNSCKAAGGTIDTRGAFAPRFYRIEDFNPNSSDQLKAYMRHFGHPIGKDKRDSTKETADASHLKALTKKYGTKFPIYKLALQLHKAIKTIGTYTPEPDAEGFLHTQYVNSPSTWRFGARKVKFGTQIQNWGSRYDPETGEGNPYAKGARKQIIARPGHTLVQIDSSSVEAVMQGYYMNDPLYMELASKSIHAWLACRALGLAFNPDNVAKVKKDHKPLYNKMKVTNYLCLTGDHEVLTPDGWCRLDAYDGKTPLAQWKEDKTLQFKSPSYYLDKPYEGEMFVLDGKSIKGQATPKHAFPARSDNRGPYKRTIVDDVNQNHRIPFTGTLEEGQAVDLTKLRLMAAIQADGHIHANGAVQFTLRRERKISRLASLLEGRPFRQSVYGKDTQFYIKAKDIWDVVGLLDEGKTFNEKFLLSLDGNSRRKFIEELTVWDGSTLENTPQDIYRSMNERNAEIVQTIAHTVGKQGVRYLHKTTGMWSVSFNTRQETRLKSEQITKTHHSGRVYCVTTDTGYFLYRYKGVIAVSGNTNFGGGDYLLWQTYPDDFPRREDAVKTQNALYELLPSLKAYHHSVRWEAHTKTYLETPWHYRHYYYDVFKASPSGQLVFGKDAKRCVAMKPQNSNGAFQKDNLLLIGATPIEGEPLTDIEAVLNNWDEHQRHIDAGETWARFMPTNVSVHDSCCLDVETPLVERCSAMQLAVFTRKIPQMHGLRVGAEVEAGRSWGELEPIGKTVIGSYSMKETEAGEQSPALAA